jgi:hypothetical protein
MKKDTVVALKKPEVVVEDPLMNILKMGAQRLLQMALEAEVNEFVRSFENILDSLRLRLLERLIGERTELRSDSHQASCRRI